VNSAQNFQDAMRKLVKMQKQVTVRWYKLLSSDAICAAVDAINAIDQKTEQRTLLMSQLNKLLSEKDPIQAGLRGIWKLVLSGWQIKDFRQEENRLLEELRGFDTRIRELSAKNRPPMEVIVNLQRLNNEKKEF
jgi:hypothetical protein